jgi:hypothetical protein
MVEPVEDFANFVRDKQTQNALEQTSFDQDADEKKAAHSISIAKVFNTHPETVYNDYDHFVQSEKSNLLGNLLDRNASLRDYVLSDPMASKVSKDDWHNLDNVSRAASPLTEPYEEELIPPGLSPAQWKRMGSAFIDTFKQAWDEESQNFWALLGHPKEGIPLEPYGRFTVQGDRPWEKQIQAAKDYQKRLQEPSWDENILSFVKSTGDLIFSPITAPAAAITGPLSEAIEEATGVPKDDAEALMNASLIAFGLRHAMKEYGAMPKSFKGRPRMVLPPELEKMVMGVESLVDRQEAFIRAGEGLAPGLNALTDSILSGEAHANEKILEEVVKAGDKTNTKELSPPQLAKFIDIVTKNQTAGIKYDTAAELYKEGERPTPGDGILGDLEGAAKQFDENANDGRDITVSTGEFSKLTPEIREKLRGNVRIGNARTVEEAKRLKDPEYKARAEVEPRPPVEGWAPKDVAERNSRIRDDIEDTSGLRPIRGPARKEAIEEAVAGAKPDEVPEIFGPGIISKVTQARINKAIKRLQQQKIDAVEKEELSERKRQMGKDWKEKSVKERIEVAEEFKDNPVYRFIRFMTHGEIADQKLSFRPKIDPKYVWPEHQEQLPPHWFKEGGMNPDQLAEMFLYKDGHSLMNDLADYHRDRGSLTNRQYLDKKIKAEVDRRMHLKYGEPDDQALERIRDEALSAANVGVVSEEVFRFHEAANAIDPSVDPPLSKTNLAAIAHEKVRGMKVTETSLKGLLREAGQMYRDTEDAHWAGKTVEAYRLAQNWRMQIEIAKQARDIQKQDRALTRTYDRTKGAKPSGIDPQHALVLQHIYRRLGLETELTEGQINEGLAAVNFTSLRDFFKGMESRFTSADGTQRSGLPSQEEVEVEHRGVIPPYDRLLDPNNVFNKRKDWTVGEMQAISRAVQAVDKIGREYNVIKSGVERATRTFVINALDAQSANMSRKTPIDQTAGPLQKNYFKFRTMLIGALKWEYISQRFDQFAKNGPFTKWIMSQLNAAAGERELRERELNREFGNAVKPFMGTGDGKVDFRRNVDNNVFHHPRQWEYTDEGKSYIPEGVEPEWPMTEEHVVATILHWLDPGAREKMLKGYKVSEEDVYGWLKQVSRKEHWDLADSIAKFYERLYKEENAVNMRLTGVAIPRVPLRDVESPYGVRQGRYWSISYDKSVSSRQEFIKHPSTDLIDGDVGLHRERDENFAAPVRLDLDVLVNQFKRRLDYISWKEPLYNVGKLARDPRFQKLIETRLGSHYMNSFEDFLTDIAGRNGQDARSAAQFKNIMNDVLRNWIKMEVLFNIPTITKHVASLAGAGMKEAGPKFFRDLLPADWLASMKDIHAADGNTTSINRDFMLNGDPTIDYAGSKEMKLRRRSYGDNLDFGIPEAFGKVGGWRRAVEIHRHLGSLPFQAADNFFSSTTWTTVFKDAAREQMEKGLSWKDAVHEASNIADTAVRKAHGSLQITNMAEIMRQTDPGTKSSMALMGFWNNVLNNLYLASARLKDVATLKRRGQVGKDLLSITADYSSYLFWPIAVEAAMDPVCGEDEHYYEAKCFAKTVGHGVAGFVPGGREITHALMHGRSPSGGLFSTLGTTGGIQEIYAHLYGNKEGDDIDWGKIGRTGLVMGSWASGLGGGNQAGRAWQLYWDQVHGEKRAPETPGEWMEMAIKQRSPKD